MASPPQAHAEVQAAVSYFISHLSSLSLSDTDKASLSSLLTSSLQAKYDSHWHPSDPERGSAYRALTRSSSTLDHVLVSSFKAANIPSQQAAKALAASMACDKWTLWIDPGCVSIRMHGAANGGIQYNSTTSLDSPTTAANNSKVTISGITEIWGKLPPSVVTSAGNATVTRPKTPAHYKHTARKSKSIINLSSASKILMQNTMSEEEEVAAEFEALALNASPAAKKSKAIAIMKPAAVHRGIASIASSENNNTATLATPPRPLPPLCFTIQESTSPYVPSFATAAAAVQVDSASTGSSAGNTIARGNTPSMLASPPLYTSDSITSSSSCSSSSSSASASDPFARPSSRSSTTSLGSATSCSIFSHASSDSRSSSIGSFTGSDEAEKENDAGNTTVTALNVAKASKGEMDAAKSFVFPGAEVSSKMTALKADTLARLPVASVPNSPSKSNTRRRHDRSASIISAASSSGSHTRSTSTRPSSRAEVRVDKETAKPQEYSNGKVGVLGGGVMLGPSKKDNNNHNNHKRNHSTASSNNGHASTLNIGKTNSRPGKSRTTSSGSITSNGSDYGYHHNQQQQHSQYQQHYNAAYTHQQVGVYNNNWANYPPAPTQIPHQYRY